jgi:uncharacterized protein CbrC (UPF0167 family)
MVYDAYERPISGNATVTQTTEISPANASTEPLPEAYYVPPYDYIEYLKQIDPERQRAEMQELEDERHRLFKESEYVSHMNAERKHRYCHTTEMTDDERARWLRELHLCEVVYNRLASAVNVNDIKIAKLKLSLQHKLAFEPQAQAESKDAVEPWLPPLPSSNLDAKLHDPTMTIQELEKFRAEILTDITRFEASLKVPGYGEAQRERWRKDIEDANVFLKAVDQVVWELESAKKGLREKEREKEGEIVGGEVNKIVQKNEVEAGKTTKAGQKGRGVDGLEAEKP